LGRWRVKGVGAGAVDQVVHRAAVEEAWRIGVVGKNDLRHLGEGIGRALGRK